MNHSVLQTFVGQMVAAPVTMLEPIDRSAIRRWCDAMSDRNPIYLDPHHPATIALGGIVAPTAMLDSWTMGHFDPIGKSGGDELRVLSTLTDLGFPIAVAIEIKQEYCRYLRPGDLITQTRYVENISTEKNTGLGRGHFVILRSVFTDQTQAEVGRMLMTILKFRAR